ncbi:hypothetical protein HanXRQr2_Chr17g0831361 [Helianthus annuus]|uniref:Uncharacterized protein n=1 Tax=Helianthus annuus TaxID=4232 RepID=A0A251RUS4_HELAN|nr:uncharacterized protein LOC110925559 [Helianthus annuus]KAF5757826.1 hypothetical protein HanXRQr2_Chr17g0831361 [Helianthus annuus]KAJ0436293.1 hypothetical protein HanIR_Chr17g0903041 [Helianthus annuus]KAJ0449603.1 hypothetical protein HanHA89_Chr17g0730411 [Helianthus annuus]
MDPKPPSGPTSPKHQSSITDETVNNRSSDAIPLSVSDSTYRSLSLTQSPPVQVMERNEDFDISSRFSSPSSSWSDDSNESLFSIHLNNSNKHDQVHLSAADAVEHSSESDAGSLRAETLNKLDVDVSDLDEPQKVVRWKTQVERLADEGVSSQGQQLESSPLTDHKASEPKKKFCWSTCDCGSCKLPKWMSCSNCKPKKKSSSQPKEANSHTPKKSDQKAGSKKRCCSGPWSVSCHCCFGEFTGA